MQPIQGLAPLRPPQMIVGTSLPAVQRPTAAPSETLSFKEILFRSIERADAARQHADRAVENLAASGGANAAVAQTAIERADATLHTATQLRDAMLGAFNEIKDLRF